MHLSFPLCWTVYYYILTSFFSFWMQQYIACGYLYTHIFLCLLYFFVIFFATFGLIWMWMVILLLPFWMWKYAKRCVRREKKWRIYTFFVFFGSSNSWQHITSTHFCFFHIQYRKIKHALKFFMKEVRDLQIRRLFLFVSSCTQFYVD